VSGESAPKIVREGHSHFGAGKGVRFKTSEGMLVMLEENHELPLVDVQFALRTGTVYDPEGKEGLARLTARMIRMGTSEMDGNEVEELIARLGGRLSIETSPSFTRLHGTVIKRNLEPFVELLASLLQRPAMRGADISHVKRETLSDIISMRDSDRALGARNFRRFLFGDHPYGRPIMGSRKSVRSIRRADVMRHYQEHFVAPNAVFGASGDVTESELEHLVDSYFGDLPRQKPPKQKVLEPKRPKGRRVLIVDKPERTQTQLFVGTLGAKAHDPDVYPLLVANTAFGGTFTARLMNEVRSKRGWSYGAYSRLGQDRKRDAWFMWTFPAAKDAVSCLQLELEMLDDFVAKGVTGKELRFAKDYLTNSHCFDVDTAAKRLDARVDCELMGLDPDHWKQFVRRVKGVKLADAKAAVQKRLSSRNLAICLVATAKDVRRDIEKLPGVQSVEVVKYNRD
jgi:zinc protease